MAKIDQLSEAIGELRAVTEGHGKKLDEIAVQLSRQNDILGDNTKSLGEHMLQTRLTQEQNKILRDQHELFKAAVEKGFTAIGDRIKPIETHVIHVQSLTRIAKYLIPVMGIPEAVSYTIQILDWFKHFLH